MVDSKVVKLELLECGRFAFNDRWLVVYDALSLFSLLRVNRLATSYLTQQLLIWLPVRRLFNLVDAHDPVLWRKRLLQMFQLYVLVAYFSIARSIEAGRCSKVQLKLKKKSKIKLKWLGHLCISCRSSVSLSESNELKEFLDNDRLRSIWIKNKIKDFFMIPILNLMWMFFMLIRSTFRRKFVIWDSDLDIFGFLKIFKDSF